MKNIYLMQIYNISRKDDFIRQVNYKFLRCFNYNYNDLKIRADSETSRRELMEFIALSKFAVFFNIFKYQ